VFKPVTFGNEYQSCSLPDVPAPEPYITALSVGETDALLNHPAVTAGVHHPADKYVVDEVSMLSYSITVCPNTVVDNKIKKEINKFFI
jgi:hypothetical protein